ncbi:MAG: regulatory iron-sulfur-containing complex subunit RicT, partial [Anaerolineales bacterium]
MKPNIIGIRFSKVGKIYHFDASDIDLQIGDHVVVETSRGRQLGEVIQFIKDPVPPTEGGWKQVERKATPADLVQRQQWQQKQTAAMIECRARAAEIKLEGIKIVAAEYSFDGTRLTFLFSSENEEKAELKSLRKDMARQFPDAAVEFRQIGPRDVAKILGGMGACG